MFLYKYTQHESNSKCGNHFPPLHVSVYSIPFSVYFPSNDDDDDDGGVCDGDDDYYVDFPAFGMYASFQLPKYKRKHPDTLISMFFIVTSNPKWQNNRFKRLNSHEKFSSTQNKHLHSCSVEQHPFASNKMQLLLICRCLRLSENSSLTSFLFTKVEFHNLNSNTSRVASNIKSDNGTTMDSAFEFRFLKRKKFQFWGRIFFLAWFCIHKKISKNRP